MIKVPKLFFHGVIDDLKDIATILIVDDVKFKYEDNRIITDGLYNPYRKDLIEKVQKHLPNILISESNWSEKK